MEQKKKRVMITVLDSINQTSMPYNEFVLYRVKNYKDEQQILLLTGAGILIPEDKIPQGLKLYHTGKNPLRIRKALKVILGECKAEGREVVIHLHHIRGAVSTLLAMLGLDLRRSTIYTIHSTFPGFRFYNKVFCLIDVLMAHKVTCVSKTSYAKFPPFVRKIKGTDMQPLQNGVNETRIDAVISAMRRRLPSTDPLRCVYVARIIPLKNHLFLVDVLSEVPRGINLKFVFVGAEDPEQQVRRYAEKKGVADRIDFTGLIPREQVFEILCHSDVYISSSTLEGLPISVLEGMYCRLPAILSDIPQHAEVAEGCSSVSLLPYCPDTWVKKIAEFYKMEHDERNRLGEMGRNHVAKNFSLKRMHQQYDKIYNEIAQEVLC